MKFNGIEHFDHFPDETIFWAGLSDVPESIRNEAQKIDGADYNPLCFGICVFHDWTEKEFAIVTDTDLSTGERCNIYYVDNDGDKHWFNVEIPDKLADQVFEACDRINGGKEMACGYAVRKSILFENSRGFVFAENTMDKKPFVTWLFVEDGKGRRDYFDGHYHVGRDEATNVSHFSMNCAWR